ncbi:MAG: holo-[acyl-carrier-protein] synthase [Candidatus Nitrohelix vancouverensis]|uniref:Holo-[acyl-carrier-protein] synthase n=1 Tax=Candidatus Nitrohelix vancouverensis TaxID=2705534 RepID=A0A7T0C2R3_9BACT|nr:MAG: holo-[acyl-carrier-protein] synthase [Candidatus Nitrohelix vancouverensis]
MIFGTGVDLVEISRIERSLEKYLEKFETRLFTQTEIDYCRSKAGSAKHFAARFAVKEAVLKSMGVGMDHGIAWTDIETLNEESGRPYLQLHGKGRALFDELELRAIHISISHTQEHAIAYAVAEK